MKKILMLFLLFVTLFFAIWGCTIPESGDDGKDGKITTVEIPAGLTEDLLWEGAVPIDGQNVLMNTYKISTPRIVFMKVINLGKEDKTLCCDKLRFYLKVNGIDYFKGIVVDTELSFPIFVDARYELDWFATGKDNMKLYFYY